MESQDRTLLDPTTGPSATHAHIGEKEAVPVTDAGGGLLVILPQGQGPHPPNRVHLVDGGDLD